MGYYGSEYREYYKNLKRGNQRENNNVQQTWEKNSGYKNKKRKESHFKSFIRILTIQTVGILLIVIFLFSTKISKQEQFNKVFETAKTVLGEDYYFKNNPLPKIDLSKLNLQDFKFWDKKEAPASASLDNKKESLEEGIEEKSIKQENIKGLGLTLPMLGKIIENENGTVTLNSGNEVFSAKEGIVSYCDKNKIIINHGDKIETIYENLGKMEVNKGDKVERNQLIGVKGSEKQGITFGILKDGKILKVKDNIEKS